MVKNVNQGLAFFWPQGHNLNKLGKGPLGNATCIPNIKALMLVVSDEKIFFMFPLYKPK